MLERRREQAWSGTGSAEGRLQVGNRASAHQIRFDGGGERDGKELYPIQLELACQCQKRPVEGFILDAAIQARGNRLVVRGVLMTAQEICFRRLICGGEHGSQHG